MRRRDPKLAASAAAICDSVNGSRRPSISRRMLRAVLALSAGSDCRATSLANPAVCDGSCATGSREESPLGRDAAISFAFAKAASSVAESGKAVGDVICMLVMYRITFVKRNRFAASHGLPCSNGTRPERRSGLPQFSAGGANPHWRSRLARSGDLAAIRPSACSTVARISGRSCSWPRAI